MTKASVCGHRRARRPSHEQSFNDSCWKPPARAARSYPDAKEFEVNATDISSSAARRHTAHGRAIGEM